MTDTTDIKWLDPWIPESDEDGLLAKDLRREVCDRHVLFGVNVRAVGTNFLRRVRWSTAQTGAC